jgi:hypothetical protein
MKALILISFLSLSTMSFAETRASDAERAFLCTSVDKLLEVEQLDMALDMDNCLSKKNITSYEVSKGTNKIKGYLTFLAPERPEFVLACEFTYSGALEIKNIVGGLSDGISCTSPY